MITASGQEPEYKDDCGYKYKGAYEPKYGDESLTEAVPGDNVSFNVKDIKKGYVASD